MNVLFLDDNEARCKAFRKKCPSSDIVNTARECIAKLQKVTYDLVFLDHDLGGEHYVNTKREDCGMEVVRWIVENRPKITHVIVHSLNVPAATLMVEKLKDLQYITNYVPFTVLIPMIDDFGGWDEFLTFTRVSL